MLPPSATDMRRTLADCARVLVLGGQAFMAYPYSDGSPVPEGVDLLHLSDDAGPVGRVHPVRLGSVGDLSVSVDRLLVLVRERTTTDSAAEVLAAARGRRADEITRLESSAEGRYGPAPMHPMAAAHALLRSMPSEAAVVDEAITTGVYVRGFHHTDTPRRYSFCRGGGLGWGMPAAVGVAIGLGGVPVLCVVGDGSAMYSPQALWTAAREHLPVVFAVVDNGQYLILKNYLRGMGGVSAEQERFVGMDLGEPALDFVALARSMGVPGTRIEATGDIRCAVGQAVAEGGPHLLHVPITAR
ncbi:MAG: thiamine pyrophosphate-dependent enzyme [Acidimicrobiales bacterium]